MKFKVGNKVKLIRQEGSWWGEKGKSKNFNNEKGSDHFVADDIFEVIHVRTSEEHPSPAYALYCKEKDFTVKTNASSAHRCWELLPYNAVRLWNEINDII